MTWSLCVQCTRAKCIQTISTSSEVAFEHAFFCRDTDSDLASQTLCTKIAYFAQYSNESSTISRSQRGVDTVSKVIQTCDKQILCKHRRVMISTSRFWGASCSRLRKVIKFETDLKSEFLQDYEHLVCFHRAVGCRTLPALVLIERERMRNFTISEHLLNLSTDLHSFCY